MSAFTDLEKHIKSDPAWEATYTTNFTEARVISENVHLVHVSGNETRISFEEILSLGHMLPTSAAEYAYCSDDTREAERRLGLPHCVYFYAGRAHESFGIVALAFNVDIEELKSGSATPFDTGGLVGKYIKWNLPDYDEKTLQHFLGDSLFDLSEWRQKFAVFLAAYFSPLTSYWSNTDRPYRSDPEEIFLKDNTWRAWVFEVRIHESIDIFQAAAWCAPEDQMNHLMFAAIDKLAPLGSLGDPYEKFVRRAIDTEGSPDFCAIMESWIRQEVCP